MREYILEFLSKQKPSIKYFTKENHKGLFSWIWSVWLSQDEKIQSLLVVYTPISIIFKEVPTRQSLIGEIDNTFYGKLSRMIQIFDTYDDAVRAQMPDLAQYTSYLQWGCDAVVNEIRQKTDYYCNCKLIHFDCVDAKLGIFSLLYEHVNKIEHLILILGRKNYIQSNVDIADVIGFLENYLFLGERFDIKYESNEIIEEDYYEEDRLVGIAVP